MQALERELISNDWIIIIFLIALVLIFVLKIINSNRLQGYTFSFFLKGFIEKRAEENPSYFSVFHAVLFVFSTIISSLFLVLIIDDFYLLDIANIFSYWQMLLLVFAYLSIKFLIDFLLSKLFRISSMMRYFLFSKHGYFYTLNIWLFPILVLYVFSFKNSWFLGFSILTLFVVRFLFIVVNNKNLILSKLFYFILYLCTLEIAPLFILYRLMIK